MLKFPLQIRSIVFNVGGLTYTLIPTQVIQGGQGKY